MLIDHAGIARLIPHAGDMCLLDGVLDWDETSIRCTTDSHRRPSNPMRRDGRLGILCGIEYAAQAMALHGAILAKADAPRGGFLASLRDLAWHEERLDDLPGRLVVGAERLHGEQGRMIYAFTLLHADHLVLAGRASVVLA